jgi:hypothetical protein
MQNDFNRILNEVSTDLKKIGCAYAIDPAELESELWIWVSEKNGQIDAKTAGRHLVSRAIELSRTNGVSSARAVSMDDDGTLKDQFAATELDPLAILLSIESEQERDRRIAGLDSLTKARLSAAECSRNAVEMGRTMGFKGRKARHVLTSWLADAEATAQNQLF